MYAWYSGRMHPPAEVPIKGKLFPAFNLANNVCFVVVVTRPTTLMEVLSFHFVALQALAQRELSHVKQYSTSDAPHGVLKLQGRCKVINHASHLVKSRRLILWLFHVVIFRFLLRRFVPSIQLIALDSILPPGWRC
jgi:hypothetical protein